jgi:hypothetical protein
VPHSQKTNVRLQLFPDVWKAYKEQCWRHGVRYGETIAQLIAEWTEQRRREGIPAYMRKGDRDATK